MVVVDTHIHLGGSRVYEGSFSEEQLIESQERWGVDISLVLPFPHAVPSMEALHDRIHRLAQERPGRFYGVAEISPALEDEAYWKEAERCFKVLGFVAVKLHTYLQPCNPLSRFADKAFEAASHYKVPIIVHTGMGIPFSMPSLMIPRARQFPDLPIVLAHAGANVFTAEAIIAAQECDNIILEPTWCGPHQARMIVDKIGSERVVMCSDLPSNLPTELTKFRTIGLTDAQVEDCLGRTAARVFKLPAASR